MYLLSHINHSQKKSFSYMVYSTTEEKNLFQVIGNKITSDTKSKIRSILTGKKKWGYFRSIWKVAYQLWVHEIWVPKMKVV